MKILKNVKVIFSTGVMYINKITPEDCAIGYLQRRDERLEKLLNNINKTIEDLNLYKPTNYKKTIELLNKIK